VLSVRFAHPPGQRFHEVRVSRPDGKTSIPGVRFVTWAVKVEGARRLWAERERELRVADYERA
jgi:hypothetical protein